MEQLFEAATFRAVRAGEGSADQGRLRGRFEGNELGDGLGIAGGDRVGAVEIEAEAGLVGGGDGEGVDQDAGAAGADVVAGEGADDGG